MDLSYHIQSDLKSFGHTEDGEDYIGEVFFVVAQSPDGHQWRHNIDFDGVAVHQEEDFIWFEDIRVHSSAKAHKLLAKIYQAGGADVTNNHWSIFRSVYGSLAYN